MSIKITADYVKAFKAADIRGVYPTEIDEELVYFVAVVLLMSINIKSISCS